MTIGTDILVDFWKGEFVSLKEAGGSLLVAALAFSKFDATDLDNYTHVDDTPWISGVFQMDSAGTPNDHSGVSFYGRIMNFTNVPNTTDTNDAPIPTAEFRWIPLGFVPVAPLTAEQFIPFEWYLPNSEPGTVYQFGYENLTNASISAEWDVHVNAKSRGPHA